MALKILLADDSMTAQNLGKKILTDAGYDVVTVSNGAAAVRKIAEVKPHVCILDIYMPGYTGLEVCARIKNAAQTSRIPVLLTVGKMEPYKPEEGARVRADGVIVKPFEATELLRAVQRFANRAHAAGKPAAPPLGPASVEKTIRLTREQIQEMMDPDSQEWRESTAKPIQVPSEVAAAPMFNVDDMLSTLQASAAPSATTPPANAASTPFLDPSSIESSADHQNVPVNVAELEQMALSTESAPAMDAKASPLPGFVDYVIAAQAETGVERPSLVTSQMSAVATLPDVVTAVATPEVVQPTPETPAVLAVPPVPAIDDTQKVDPEILAAARRASLAAEISLRMVAAAPAQAEQKTTQLPDVSGPDPEATAAPAGVIPATTGPDAAATLASPAVSVTIPPVDANLEITAPAAIHAVQDPNLQTPVSDKADAVTEPGLEPTSLTAADVHVSITKDPDLTAYSADPATGPKNGTGSHATVPGPEFSVTGRPKADEPWPQFIPAGVEKPSQPAASSEVTEDIAAALDILATQVAVASPATRVGATHWVADEVAVPDTEMAVSLLEEMQRSRSLRETKPADGAPMPEATVRDNRNSPDSTAVPGAEGTARSTRDVANASELAAAMAAAFGGALPTSELARAEATQPISEEVRRFALGDAYKPKARATFSGAAIGDADEPSPSASGSINELRLAKAINRAIDRLKPQLVAEILKELKSLEE